MHVDDNKISVRVISDTKGILQMEREWNDLVGNSCKNPFLLSRFVSEFIESYPKNWAPLILVISLNQTIIGIAPFMIRQKFGVRSVKASNPLWCSGFIINSQFRRICITSILDFLFKTLKCKYIEFTLPCDSLNFRSLLHQCTVHKIHVKTFPKMGRTVIPIRYTWSEFLAGRGTKYRAKMRRIERNLTKLGSWKTVYADGNKQPEAIKKIFEIEKNSWKDEWRTQTGQSNDESLMTLLSASQHLSKEPKFKLNISYLELDGKAIAYCTAIEYCDVAFIVKTSYDKQYKKFYPGIFIQNALIRELFNSGKIKQIDFLSDLSYLRTWSNECILRNGIILANGILPATMQFIYKTVIEKIMHKIV